MYYRFKRVFTGTLLATGLFMQSCKNLYADFGDRSSDAYLIEQARMQLDAYNFDAAIAAITPVLATQPTNEDVVYLASASYAGRAGLRILDLFSAIGTDASTKGIIQIFAEHFPGADDDSVADIAAAVQLIENYSAVPSARGGRLNFYMTFLLFSQIGVINSRYALDADGVLNPDFSPCRRDVATTGPTGMPNESVDVIIGAFIKIPDTIANAGSDAFSSISGSFVIPEPAATCANTEGSVECLLMRNLIGTGPLLSGIGFEIFPDLNPLNICASVLP
jgi:hypothetical protein